MHRPLHSFSTPSLFWVTGAAASRTRGRGYVHTNLLPEFVGRIPRVCRVADLGSCDLQDQVGTCRDRPPPPRAAPVASRASLAPLVPAIFSAAVLASEFTTSAVM